MFACNTRELLAHVASNHFTIFGQGRRHHQRAVAHERPHLQHPLSVADRDQRVQKVTHGASRHHAGGSSGRLDISGDIVEHAVRCRSVSGDVVFEVFTNERRH